MTDDRQHPESTLISLQPVVLLTRRGLFPYDPSRDVVVIEHRSGGSQLVLSTKDRGHTVLVDGPAKHVNEALFYLFDRLRHGFAVISLQAYEDVANPKADPEPSLWG